jgi:hypothetical protein
MASSDRTLDPGPTQATRVRNFAGFFKNYMSVSSVVVASLPIPVTSFNLIKTYSAQTKMLSVYASLFCFLILGFVFFSRHLLGRVMFAGALGFKERYAAFLVGALPLLLILGSISMVFSYQSLLSESLVVARARALAAAQGGQLAGAYLYDMDRAANRFAELDIATQFLSDRSILASAAKSPVLMDIAVSVANREGLDSHGDTGRVSKVLTENLSALAKEAATAGAAATKAATAASAPTPVTPAQIDLESYIGDLKPLKYDPALESPLEAIPWSMLLVAYYVGIFAFAEAAFVLMALKEYLLDLLHLSDRFLITGEDPAAPTPITRKAE